MIRRGLSRIAVRLLLFNVLVVFIPAAGVFSMHTLERQLLELQERSLVQQARLVASALSGGPLDANGASTMLRRLESRSESRIRIVDPRGAVVADSARGKAARTPVQAKSYPSSGGEESRTKILYRIGALLWRPVDLLIETLRTERTYSSSSARDAIPSGVVRVALEGRYGATVRESTGQRSLTMYSALPLRDGGGSVTGVVVVSQSTSRILRALWLFRVDLFRVVVISLAVAAGLSLLLAGTIARPLRKLRDEADNLLDRRGRLRGRFRGSSRADEIGDLSRALETLTERLERHIAFVESFSADVSHEFKNPLASIRSSAELLATSTSEEERLELCDSIEREVARLTRLIGGVREVSKIDAGVESEPAERLDARELLAGVRSFQPGVRIETNAPEHAVYVVASRDRLRQAITNLIDNAASFSPADGVVRVDLSVEGGMATVRVDDDGPGVPPEHLDRIFDRFFTFRPDDRERRHDGLGLAITRAIVEAYGGGVAAANRVPRGARFEITLPVAVR